MKTLSTVRSLIDNKIHGFGKQVYFTIRSIVINTKRIKK